MAAAASSGKLAWLRGPRRTAPRRAAPLSCPCSVHTIGNATDAAWRGRSTNVSPTPRRNASLLHGVRCQNDRCNDCPLTGSFDRCCGSGDAAPPVAPPVGGAVTAPPEEPQEVVKTFDASTASRTPRTAHRARAERVGRGRDGKRRQLSTTTSSPGLTPPSPMRHPGRTARACDHRPDARVPRGARRPQRESPNAAQTPCQSTRSARQHSPLQSPRRCTLPTPSHTSYARPTGAGCFALLCSVLAMVAMHQL